eukprot:6482244-Amphidinium_carterae.1
MSREQAVSMSGATYAFASSHVHGVEISTETRIVQWSLRVVALQPSKKHKHAQIERWQRA